ncbi:MAG: hypothetical protein IPK88_12485 [Saprospiraceae bacterium]|nr:hypothetical protein [Candidatus Defluviibacterium haderslevense]
MKRYSHLILILLFYQISDAQDTIRIEDILKKHTKEKQSNKPSKQAKQSSDEKEVSLNVFRQAVQSSIYMIEVQYHLLKDKKVFGKGDDDFFGSTKAVAISNGKQLLIDPTSLEPWNLDPDFKDYKNEYTPELYKIKVSEFEKATNVEYSPNQFTYKVQNGIGSLDFNIKSFKGLDATTIEDQPGFVILYYEAKKGNDPDVLINFHDGIQNNNSYDQESLLGGFYIQIIPSHGLVECKLSGIVVRTNKGNAELKHLNTVNKSSSTKETKSSKAKSPLKEVKQKK